MILLKLKQERYLLCSVFRLFCSYGIVYAYLCVMLELQIVKPRPVQAASIPGMIGMFQNVCPNTINGVLFFST